MKLYKLIPAALCGILLLPPAVASTPRQIVPASPPRERQFTFEYKTTIKDIPPGTRKFDLWIPVPRDTHIQRVTDMRTDSPHPYRVREAEHGNRVLHVSLSCPTREGFIVTMSFSALRREYVQERLRQGGVVATSADAAPART